MGLVRGSESPGQAKPLAQIVVSEERSQRSQQSSRRWISLAAEWTKWFHLVTLHVNVERRKHNDTFRTSRLVHCSTAENLTWFLTYFHTTRSFHCSVSFTHSKPKVGFFLKSCIVHFLLRQPTFLAGDRLHLSATLLTDQHFDHFYHLVSLVGVHIINRWVLSLDL